jgi:hypothetical protein
VLIALLVADDHQKTAWKILAYIGEERVGGVITAAVHLVVV